MKKKIDTIKKLAQELLEKMGVKAQIKATEDKENQAVAINLDSPEDNALLVGYHGRNLAALQIILGIMAANKLGEWTRVIVNIGNYREERKAQLEEMAQRSWEQVKESREPVVLPNLNSNERRIVHLFLKDKKGVETLSEGEGRQRQLIIKPKEK